MEVRCCRELGYWRRVEVYFLKVQRLNRLNYMDFFVRKEGVLVSDGMGGGLGCVL